MGRREKLTTPRAPHDPRETMANRMVGSATINTPKQLYKYLLRECDNLPKHAQQFYKHSVKQSFKQHVSESDEERIQQIMEKALLDAKWVIQKYNQPGGTPTPK
ncbi:PREDICTED: LYR motif-containing protein 9-like [Atta cephalotes]|uniref:LYR motif-containing protein 9 n=1 Tax=Atta cephalotes TaxID=12957 RepID=A0A158NNA6_ATTCE|nr:PREDICTED: LYR motif-containing protein 9-like [Atta cephalotes]